jgi:hypothetical protein
MGYHKIENFMLISKMLTYLSDKMPPQEVNVLDTTSRTPEDECKCCFTTK